MAPERRLAAIMFTDIVGYTALMERDEMSALGARDRHRTLLKTLVEQFHGEVIESPGDEALVLFDSALHAVDCGLALQAVLRDDSGLAVRVGIHLGDVVLGDGEVAGEGVNLAARIRPLSAPGGICISEPVYQAVRNRKHVVAHPLGPQSLKNVAEPLQVYALDTEPSAQLQPQRSTTRWGIGLAVTLVAAVVVLTWWLYVPARMATGPPLTAIAVLPFDDLSSDGDHAWLANGMAEALIENLSRIEALRVPARTSTQLMKEQKADFATIGEKLRVGAIVEGSVQRSGDALRVVAQLISVADGDHLWSARYDRKLDDVFEIQQEISREIAEAIRDELGAEEEWSLDRVDRFARYDPQDVRAYELVRKGIEAAVRDNFSLEGIPERLAYYEQALEIDPTYATAHAVIGNLSLQLASASDGDRRQENLARARAAIQRALELDNEDRTALRASAAISSADYDWEEALSRYRQALELYPRDSLTLTNYGSTLATVGQVEEAFIQLQRSVELEDVLGFASLQLGRLNYYFKGDFDTALGLFNRAIERQPGFESILWRVIASSYHRKGMATEALQAGSRGFPAEAELPMRRGYEDGGWVGMLRVALDSRLGESELRCPEPRFDVMALSANLGDRDRMFDCLEFFNTPLTCRFSTLTATTPASTPSFASGTWKTHRSPRVHGLGLQASSFSAPQPSDGSLRPSDRTTPPSESHGFAEALATETALYGSTPKTSLCQHNQKLREPERLRGVAWWS